MPGRGRLALVGAVLGVVAVVAAGCSSASGDSGGGNAAATAAASTTTAAAAGGGGNEIKLTAQNIKYDKTSLQITSGGRITVEVTNKDSIEHNFTFQAANVSKDVEGGEDATVKFTAPAAGTYEFHCKYHPSAMKGTITVS